MNDWVRVVGGSNQIAAWLVPELLLAGHEVTVDSRSSQPPWIAPHPQLEWRGPAALPDGQIAGPAAALVYIGPLDNFARWWDDPPPAARVIVFSSTSRFTKLDSSSAAERTMARTLAAGEAQVKSTAGDARVTVLRPTMVYGAGLDRNLTRVAGWLRRYKFMPMPGPGAGLRQPVHARDLARAVTGILEAGAHGDFQLAGGTTLSYRSMLAAVFASLDQRARFVPVPRVISRPALWLLRQRRRWSDLTPAMLDRLERDLVFDDSAARREFGYDPQPFKPAAQTWLRLDQRSGSGL